MARPLIATDVPGCREVVDDVVNGYFCNPADSGSLASLMKKFAELPIDFFFSSRRRQTSFKCDWSSDVCSSDLEPELQVLHRRVREGLGYAYLAGFRVALEGDASHVIEMDADFSHEPHDLPRLLKAAEGADLVLGSRYVEGGVVADWGLLRRFVSRGGSIYARRVLGLDVADLTGGFKCFRREVLEAISLSSIRSRGYAFQVELT